MGAKQKQGRDQVKVQRRLEGLIIYLSNYLPNTHPPNINSSTHQLADFPSHKFVIDGIYNLLTYLADMVHGGTDWLAPSMNPDHGYFQQMDIRDGLIMGL